MGYVSIAELQRYHYLPQAESVTRIVRQVFPQNLWVTFTAIADAESGFNPTLVNSSGAVGLFQILIAAHPGVTKAAMLNPVLNAQFAYQLYRKVGLTAWAGDNYPAYLGVAQQLVSRTAPSSPAVARPSGIVVRSAFRIQGTAHVSQGGRIVGAITLYAQGGSVPVRITMAVTPTYGSTSATSTTATVTIPANTKRTVKQSLVAPLPAHQILVAYQQRSLSGSVTFPYAIQWVIRDTATNQTRTVKRSRGVYLTV